MAKPKKNVRKSADKGKMLFTRFMLIIAVFVVWIGGIGVRLVHLQVQQHDALYEQAVNQRINIKKKKLPRGSILDRNGRVLAMSVPVKTLFADPAEIEDVAAASKQIAKAIGQNEKQVLSQLKDAKASGKRYVPLAKKLDKETVDKVNKALHDSQIKKADEPYFAGLHWTDDQTRSYPHGRLAANVIGSSNAEDQGIAGIEQSQDEVLRGAIIKSIQERDRLGRVYDEISAEREPPNNIVLTIDSTLQFYLDEALEKGVRNADAKSGMAIAIDPKTGEILGLSNYPSFDPSTKVGQGNDLSNHIVQSVYAPGSVFKLVTYASALEKHLIKPEDEIDAGNGTIDVAGHVFRDSHHVGRVSYSEALAHSSNVCAIKTSMRVGKTDFYSMVQKMGFGARTGIELPAETSGIVRAPEKWNGDSQASMSIGYEIGVTALQMANAFATIANDGIKNQPHIIKEIKDAEDNTVSATEPQQTQVVSAETAASLRKMLRQVVLTGTGKRAQLDGYTSAGKTGTAWKFNPVTKRVDPGKYISSFIGFAPADDPKIVIAVVIDEPKNGARDGGGVAAPIFKEAAEAILREMNVKPDLQGGPDTNVADDVPETPEVPSTGSTDEILGTTDDRSGHAKQPAKTNSQGKTKQPTRKSSDIVAGLDHSRVGKFGQWEVWVTKPKT